MTQRQEGEAAQARIAQLEQQLQQATDVAAQLYRALNEASSMIDPPNGEHAAYQVELALGARFLRIPRSQVVAEVDFERWCLMTCQSAGLNVPTDLASEAALIIERTAPYRLFQTQHQQPHGGEIHRAWIADRLKVTATQVCS
jgi:hypothetical protein